MSLFIKELKHVMRGFLYIAFVGAVVLFYATQFGSVTEEIQYADEIEFDSRYELTKPLPGQNDYGTNYVEVPEIVMPNVLYSLLSEWSSGTYITYPLGFYKSVHSSQAMQKQIEDIVIGVTGVESIEGLIQKIENWREDNYQQGEDGIYMISPNANIADAVSVVVTYETFSIEMSKIDAILGGGSNYDPESFIRSSPVPRTYEQALEAYNSIIYEDKISSAFARLFCDYTGISIALFSVFVPVGFLLRDRKANMQQLIFSRRCSSAKLIGVRYAACLTAVLLPIVLLGIIPTVQLGMFAAQKGLPYNPFSFLLYTLGWLAPSAMVTCSVGFFFTLLTGTPIGVAVQFFWSFLDFFSIGSGLLYGGKTGLRLTLRHNIVGQRQLVDWQGILANRIGYTLFALLLLCFSILFYELQRRGKLNVYDTLSKIFRRHKNTVPLDAAA